jgi:NAD(P)-dependent dehydrogenase (short-subunit alcohol dehydrogenase family)
MLRLEGKVAIVTGAASGIGEATARLFAKEGAKVVVADLDHERGDKVVREIKRDNGEAVFTETDVSKWSDVRNLVETTIKTYGRIDILHNNAGIGLLGTVVETSEKAWDKIIDINLKGVYLCSRAVIPQMMKQGGGVIVNTASNWGLVAQPNSAAYCASKGGVVMLTRAMAIDHAKDNIRVNALCPGYVDTPLLHKIIDESKDPQKELEEMGKLAQPLEMAYGALFLACDESSHATGSCLVLDNGETARGGSVKDHLPKK